MMAPRKILPRIFIGIILVLILAAAFYWILRPRPRAVLVAPNPAAAIGVRTKISDCAVKDSLPDRACTPGAIFPSATVSQICVPGYSRRVRDVSSATKRSVYEAYGIYERVPGEYEVYHLIPLTLGGSNDVANLWPEAANPRPGCHEKDWVENYLHRQVCSGKMTLAEAQAKIVTDWRDVYILRMVKR